ncbi:hypothetical protein, partial [Staphylococcus aureus]
TAIFPVWYNNFLADGTIPGLVQWLLWFVLFPVWWKAAPTVRARLPFAYWSLAIVAISCAFRPVVIALFEEEHEEDDFSSYGDR